MKRQEATSEIDSILLPFLNATDEEESQQQLELLVTSAAEPVLRTIVRRKFQPTSASGGSAQAIEDVYGEALLQLLARLRQLRANPGERPITDFRSYVAVLAYNACNEHLRQKYPQRYSLKNRLRYVVSHNQKFALWEGDNELHCGLSQWRKNGSAREGGRRLQQLRYDAKEFETCALSRMDLRRTGLAELLAAVFQSVNNPVELDSLVDAVADWTGVKNETTHTGLDDASNWAADKLVDRRPSLDVEVGNRLYLQRLWSEISQLPLRQRTALLMNLRDSNGDECIGLFPLAGVAIRDIAEALGFSAEHLAEMWNQLPLDDTAIAKQLGITRQQVINLRKSARERLARRMKALEAGV